MKCVQEKRAALLQWLKKPTYDSASILYILTAFLGVVAFGLVLWFGVQYFSGVDSSRTIVHPLAGRDTEEDEEGKCMFTRLLDGVCVQTADDVSGRHVAIMIENHFEANPLSGIGDASVVYEAPVEGHIPRLLAIYPATADVSKVGPVRSARPYYLDWVSEYGDPMYMHVGGSPEALEKIWAFDIFDMNEFSRGWYYWRSDERSAPHNTYTSSKLWNEAFDRYGTDELVDLTDGWKFGPMDACVDGCVSRIDIEHSLGGYDIAWEYNTTTEQYERTQFGRVHADAGGPGYVADTVLLQRVDAEVVDEIGRLHIATIGEGEGYVFRNGYAIHATWEKESRTSRTRWFDEQNEEITLKPGKIWVQVVSQYGSVDVTVAE